MRPLLLAIALVACGTSASTDPKDDTDPVPDTDAPADTDPAGTDGQLTLSTCDEDLALAAPAFFRTYFACVDLSVDDGDAVVASDGLPPHPSAYYPDDHVNHVAFDTRGGTHRQNPNTIGAQSLSFTIPSDPVAKDITIDASIVDNEMGTSPHEYSGGPVGIALDGVAIFAAMAAAGDDLAEEQFTFDLYEAHPAGTTYHYHFNTPGPLEVLADRGFTTDTSPGTAAVELYGMMCDGTVVLGCTELDGSAPSDDDFDAQNGHIHDVGDGSTTFFTNRYHTHVCPGSWPDYPFFPEIAYYQEDPCPTPGRP